MGDEEGLQEGLEEGHGGVGFGRRWGVESFGVEYFADIYDNVVIGEGRRLCAFVWGLGVDGCSRDE